MVDSIFDGQVSATIHANTRYEWPIKIEAKLDTGADRSSIDLDLAKGLGYESVREVKIKNANGVQTRPCFLLNVEINGYVYEIEASGANRSNLNYPFLIGLADLREIYEEE